MRKHTVVAVAILVCLAGTWAEAAPGDLLQTFPNPLPSDYAYFGWPVAGAGSSFLVGAHGNNTGAEYSGAVYEFDGSGGEPSRAFLNPTPSYGDGFGFAVSSTDSKIVIIAPWADDGTGYIFDRSTGNPLQTFYNPTPSSDDYFGCSMAAAGNKVLVGDPYDGTWGTYAGAAYLFDTDTGGLLHTLQPSYDGSFFGASVAMTDEAAFVGATWDETGESMAGAVHMFSNSTGLPLHTFLSPTPTLGEDFGYSVDAVGNYVVIGAPYTAGSGKGPGTAYLFDVATGELLQTLQNPTAAESDRFGVSVAFIGDDILVGDTYDDTGAENAGAAYLFDATTGALLQTFLNPTPDIHDHFGASATAFGENVVISAHHDNTGALNAGAAYLFELIPEPATLGLLLMGGLALLRRRRM